ncbi:phosphatase PAP2 family protein [Actinomadura parmotrematis]|uniref:Phosphatase PAP2 family protein n=1 Tax=Actinomadura parmotrematis TaxID=2864039 RepID=A0ABS7FRQ0_9ACTN|nr:phosphatase PAP2 family protein [Actinomadura parmotrematis]MBW8483078.1 phosphatase PAP2 family protein [Actinomadura parmotrematis]
MGGGASKGRPGLLGEALLIGVGYVLYSMIQNGITGHAGTAFANARRVLELEERLGIAVERRVNRYTDGVPWLVVTADYFYSIMWIAGTLGVLGWLYLRRPGEYRPARRTLFATTLLALLGFWRFPLAPPRLLPGYVDTVVAHGTWGSFSDGELASVSNHFAAMPSMHFGWSLWAGLVLIRYARPVWVRVLGGLYPVATLLVIIATANHYVLDAVGGAAALLLGYLAQRAAVAAARSVRRAVFRSPAEG